MTTVEVRERPIESATAGVARQVTQPPPPPRRDDERWWLLGIVLAVTALLVAMVGVVVRAGGGSGTGEPSAPTEVTVTLGDLWVKPAVVEVASGRPIRLMVHNTGTMAHDLKANGTDGTALIPPGETATVTIRAITRDTEAWCTTPGHRAAGMSMLLKVAVNGSPAGAAVTTAAGAPAGSAGATPASPVIDPNATPAAGWRPYDPVLAPAPGATEHKLTLHATEKVMEVAPGVTQELWTFGDQVPGPTLRGHVGDVFTVTLVNDGKLGHSIDFHASRVAWNDKMRTIQPGESLVYQYKAEYAGIFMYHCGTAPALHHIGNGMYGAVIIDPPALAPVAHEYVLVQSELYLGPQGKPGDLTKMQHEAWDAVVFNGYVNQYKHAPIRVEPGERARVWVLDAGPSENSSFHIVGTVFDTVFKEGTYALRPDDRRGGSQALDLQPAQGGFVEFSFAEAGLYPIVTHKFANVGKGALALFQAGDVGPSAAGH